MPFRLTSTMWTLDSGIWRRAAEVHRNALFARRRQKHPRGALADFRVCISPSATSYSWRGGAPNQCMLLPVHRSARSSGPPAHLQTKREVRGYLRLLKGFVASFRYDSSMLSSTWTSPILI